MRDAQRDIERTELTTEEMTELPDAGKFVFFTHSHRTVSKTVIPLKNF